MPLAEIANMAGCGTATIRTRLQMDGVPRRFRNRRLAPGSRITRAWLEREYMVKLRSIGALARERGVTAAYLMSLARNWGLPIRHHSQFSGIGHLDLPVPPSPAIRAVTMRKGALGWLELITRIPDHDNIAAAARVLYDGRASAMAQMLHKIETAAGFAITDRSCRPLAPNDGRPRVHLRSVPDPPDRSGARRPTGLPAGGQPEPPSDQLSLTAQQPQNSRSRRRRGHPLAEAAPAIRPRRAAGSCRGRSRSGPGSPRRPRRRAGRSRTRARLAAQPCRPSPA